MAIKNGEDSDADEVMNAMGKIVTNQAQVIFDSKRNGWHTDLNGGGTPNFENLNYDVMLVPNSGIVGGGSSVNYNDGIDTSSDPFISFSLVLDEFGTGSIDNTIWTEATSGTGAISETGGYAFLQSGGASGSATIISDGGSGLDLDTANNGAIYLKWNWDSVSATGANSSKIQISDGSNHVDIVAKGNDASGTEWLKILINPTSNEAKVSVNGGALSGAIDISSVTGGYFIRVLASHTFSGGSPFTRVKVYNLHYLPGDGSTSTLITQDHSAGETVTNAILVVNDDISNGANATHSYFLSADGGSNYEAVTPGTIHRFTDTGSTVKAKVVATTTDAVDFSDADNATEIFEFAIFYNFY